MAESVMGHALKTTPGRVFQIVKDRPMTWHHDWRGKVTISALYSGLVISGAAVGYAVWHLLIR